MSLTTSLVSYYKMESTADSIGVNTLTNHGSVSFASPGKILNGATLSPTSQWLDTTNAIAVAGTSDFTWAGWVNFSSFATEDQFVCQGAPGFGGQRGQTGMFNFFVSVNASKLRFYAEDNNITFITDSAGSTTLSTGVWYFIAFCWHSGGTSTVYLNGSSEISGTFVSAGIASNVSTTIGGKWTGAAVVGTFNGLIDEVGYWTRQLSSGEVTSLYNSGNGLTYPFTTSFNTKLLLMGAGSA